MPGLSKKETARLLDYIEPQGVDITPVKNGYLLRLPNGETTTVHLSVSDHRGPANLRSTLKRAGVKWPTDAVKGEIVLTPNTVKYGEKLLKSFDHADSIKQTDLKQRAEEIGWSVAQVTIRRFMISRGYQGIGGPRNYKWQKIKPLITERKELEEEPITAEVIPLNHDQPNPLDRVIRETPREFLDSHDSWTVDLDILPDTLTIKDVAMMYKATGLNFEIRVWK